MSFCARSCNDAILITLTTALALRFKQINRKVEDMVKEVSSNNTLHRCRSKEFVIRTDIMVGKKFEWTILN